MDAIILAGGETPEKLCAALGSSTPAERALLEIKGRPSISYVLDSLTEVAAIEKVVVVGLPSTLAVVAQLAPAAVRVPAATSLVQNVTAGMNAATSSHCLLCTCDIPLVTPGTWREFLSKAEANKLEAAYPIASRQTIEQKFPEGERTYVTLTDGTFTGGNAFILPRNSSRHLEQLINAAYNSRKNPLRLLKLLGLKFLFQALRKKLSIADLEQKMSQVLGCRAGAVPMQDATIGFDIDKIEDYELAQRVAKATL